MLDLANDETYQRLNSGSEKWGDIALDTPTPSRSTTPAPCGSTHQEPTQQIFITPENEDRFYNWECPEFTQRKQIWETFPVTLIPLGKDKSGAERHSVQWHRKNLMEGRDETDFSEYLGRTERRLLKALNASSKWDVLDSEMEEWFVPGKDLDEIRKEICIISMVYLPSSSVEAPAKPEAAEAAEATEATERANDLAR